MYLSSGPRYLPPDGGVRVQVPLGDVVVAAAHHGALQGLTRLGAPENVSYHRIKTKAVNWPGFHKR